ncbi:hypothetical protein [Duganella radicis]|uniref:Hemolysin XhlA n=1 Tax=Duganella radicis TaxID=551988 RepID=A0A6L6PQG0_9BURK|nr:hypothetical protein [Duganella radicis]MTV40927.1 hypothetical protein [Duganella radicis]
MDIDARLDKIEVRLDKHDEMFVNVLERLSKIETRLDHIETTMVTKEDLERLTATMIKWMVGMFVGSGIAAITVMTFVLNNAVPKAPPQPPPAPIIIQVPPYK